MSGHFTIRADNFSNVLPVPPLRYESWSNQFLHPAGNLGFKPPSSAIWHVVPFQVYPYLRNMRILWISLFRLALAYADTDAACIKHTAPACLGIRLLMFRKSRFVNYTVKRPRNNSFLYGPSTLLKNRMEAPGFQPLTLSMG